MGWAIYNCSCLFSAYKFSIYLLYALFTYLVIKLICFYFLVSLVGEYNIKSLAEIVPIAFAGFDRST